MCACVLQMTGVANYFEREVKRCAFVQQRKSVREKERIQLESEVKVKAGVSTSLIRSRPGSEHL